MLEKILKQQPVDGRSLFVDMNSFFASVEQQANPALRGNPVGVCPFLSNATCVIAASIEAKRYGVKTGTNVAEAKRLCPEIILVPADPRLYREYHRRIMDEMDNIPCRIVIKSIDEALLIVPSYLLQDVLGLAAEVRRRVLSVGSQLRCSIGIGSNLFLAKMGSNAQKPDGLVEIKQDQLAAFYQQLTLTDLHGISWRMALRLKHLGIYMPLDFYAAPYSLLKRTFGVNGEAWYLRLRGYETDLKPTTRRMIGHQTTIIPGPATTRAQVMSVASQLTYRVATRLRAANLTARGIVVYIRYNDRSGWQKVYRGKQPFSDSRTFFNEVQRLFGYCRMSKPVRLVSVSVIDLIDQRYITQTLFDDHSLEDRLATALDEINFRYGEATIVTGRQLTTPKIHDAIGFGNAAQNARELPR